MAGPVEGSTEQDLAVTAVEPYVAESWKFSNGKRTLTFKLRPGLKFPSGGPVDANAVKYSLEGRPDRGIRRLLGPRRNRLQAAADQIDLRSELADARHQLQATGAQPVQVLSTPTAGAIYDPKLLKEHGGQKPATPIKWLGTHSAGYGPYNLKSYKPNQELVLEANPDFFQQPKTKNIIIKFVPQNETLLLQAQSGQADVTLGMSGQAAKSLEGNSCCIVNAAKSRQAQTLNFPENDKAPFNSGKFPFFLNQKFREALSYAFPYEAVLQKVGYGYGELYNGEWMPAFSWYDPKVGAPRETNVEKAEGTDQGIRGEDSGQLPDIRHPGSRRSKKKSPPRHRRRGNRSGSRPK